MQSLRIEIGGEVTPDPVLARLESDLSEFFQQPVASSTRRPQRFRRRRSPTPGGASDPHRDERRRPRRGQSAARSVMEGAALRRTRRADPSSCNRSVPQSDRITQVRKNRSGTAPTGTARGVSGAMRARGSAAIGVALASVVLAADSGCTAGGGQDGPPSPTTAATTTNTPTVTTQQTGESLPSTVPPFPSEPPSPKNTVRPPGPPPTTTTNSSIPSGTRTSPTPPGLAPGR
jgi:hypothetical protein